MLLDVDVWVWDRKKLSQNYDLESNSPLPPIDQGTGTNILFSHHVKEDGAKLGICGHGLTRQQEEHRSNLTVTSWHLLSAA